MQLKVYLKKDCTLSKFVVPSTAAALAVSLSKNCDEREEELGDWHENGSEDKRKSLTREVRGKKDEYERAAASKGKSGHLEKQPYPHILWGVWNLAHFLGLNELFHPSHTVYLDPFTCLHLL